MSLIAREKLSSRSSQPRANIEVAMSCKDSLKAITAVVWAICWGSL
jgi:hypothetical protein